jgi:hypothetical protein
MRCAYRALCAIAVYLHLCCQHCSADEAPDKSLRAVNHPATAAITADGKVRRSKTAASGASSVLRNYNQLQHPADWSKNRRFAHDPLDSAHVNYCREAMQRMLSKPTDSTTLPSLVMYHLGGLGEKDAMLADVYINNIHIFTSALSPADNAFYIFNVGGGPANPYLSHLPKHLAAADRMCVIDWPANIVGDITAAAIAVAQLGTVVSQFGAVLYLNNGVRGPFAGRAGGLWLKQFVGALRPEEGIVAVGPSHSCFFMPHLQTHIYALSTLVLPAVVAYQLAISERVRGDRQAYIEHVEVGMSQFLYHNGFKVGSTFRTFGDAGNAWDGVCTDRNDDNPAKRCDLIPEEHVFLKYGGEVMRRRAMCSTAIGAVGRSTQAIIDKEPDSDAVPIWPERTPYSSQVG